MHTYKQFLFNYEKESPQNLDRAIALLWFITTTTDEPSISVSDLCKMIEEAGFSKQNPTRITHGFNKSRKIVKNKSGFRISPSSIDELNNIYSNYSSHTSIKVINGLIDSDLFIRTRGYIVKIVEQINLSFDYGLYDCCAVMCRRLLETLIIEVYEHKDLQSEIKDSDNNYLMFSGLLIKIENQTHFHLARNALKGLKDFKTLGDLSAHNRRFNARITDIKPIQEGLRIAIEELLHLANLGI